MSYPKSFIKNISGNGVEKVAHNLEEEQALRADHWEYMGVEEEPIPAPKPVVKPKEKK